MAAATATQTSHQVIQHGNAPAVSHSIHKPHGSHAAAVVSAPIFHPTPVLHAAPVVHKPVVIAHPAPIVHKPAPVFHAAPVVVHKPVVVAHPAPVFHPAPEPSYDEPAVYKFGYAVADDYSGANFQQNENRDGYATTGEYRVALPDGRTQIVTYSTADGYSGNVADVRYEGEAHYDQAPIKAHPAPVYHA